MSALKLAVRQRIMKATGVGMALIVSSFVYMYACDIVTVKAREYSIQKGEKRVLELQEIERKQEARLQELREELARRQHGHGVDYRVQSDNVP